MPGFFPLAALTSANASGQPERRLAVVDASIPIKLMRLMEERVDSDSTVPAGYPNQTRALRNMRNQGL